MRFPGAVLIAIAVAGVVACRGETPAGKPPAPATVANPVAESQLATVTLSDEAIRRLAIAVAPAALESVTRTRTVGGEVIAPPGRSVSVTAPIAGTVQGTVVRPGTRVSRGQTVFSISPLQPAERDQSIDIEREVATATAELAAAEQRFSRLEQLLKEGATSVRSVEEARAQRDVAAARLNAARSRGTSLRAGTVGSRGEIAVRSPIAGVLQDVSAAPGQTVAAAAPLFSVAEADALWVRVPVFVGERSDVDLSLPAAIRSLSTHRAPAVLASRVEGPPSANPAAATTDVYYAPATSDYMRLGERVSVELPLRESQRALVVPDSALLYDQQGGTWVYEAVGNNAYVRRRVEVGGQVARKVIITRGLSAGQNVVIAGAAELFGTEFGAGK